MPRKIYVQLAALLSYGEKLYSSCYNLESDGQFIFRAYEEWRKVVHCLPADGPYPQPLKKVMKTIAADPEGIYSFEDLRGIVARILQPARVYMAQQELAHDFTIKAFKAASLWNPLVAKSLDITPELLAGYVAVMRFISPDHRRALEEEVESYKAACDLVEGDVKVLSSSHTFLALPCSSRSASHSFLEHSPLVSRSKGKVSHVGEAVHALCPAPALQC